ncbi:MAG: hypothetical protein KKA28_15565 [Planctomycetes bacterium]|nr:hypothetical protein [Planctomycetota bacterium]
MTIRILAGCFLISLGTIALADDAPSKADAKPEQTATEPKPTLSPEMAALRDRVRSVLAAHSRQTFNTRDNSATEILGRCLAFGCETEVSLESPRGQRINGITCLCWNYPCAGYNMLGYSREHIAARIGYGYQEHPGEFLAMLAMSRVPADYPVRVGKDERKVSDLVEAEKLGCREGSDKSLALIGLSYYLDEPVWQNDLGQQWSIERIIEEEIARPILTAPEGGLNRLMGLNYAVERREKEDEPIEGQFERAKKYIGEYQDYALKLQNSDGGWGPHFLAAKSTAGDPAAQLRATGRVLEWLALSLPDQRLQDSRVVNSVHYLTRLLGSQRYRWNAPSLNTQEIVSLCHALHALAIYNQRVFKPFDAEEKPEPASA